MTIRKMLQATPEELVRHYLEQHRDERAECGGLLDLIDTFPKSTDQIRRDNMQGHITASALILTPAFSHVLLIQHKTLGRRLPPGGHLEPDDASVLAGVYREIREETGVSAAELELLAPGLAAATVADINTHTIPSVPVKREIAHPHHDLRFLFVYRGNRLFPRPSPEDGEMVAWEVLDVAFSEPEQSYLPAKIRRLVSRL